MNTKQILTEQIYPRLYSQANQYFPEFGFKRNGNGWISTTTLKADGTDGNATGKVYLYKSNPWGFKDYRLNDFVSFWDYIAQRDNLVENKEILLHLANLTGVDLEKPQPTQSSGVQKLEVTPKAANVPFNQPSEDQKTKIVPSPSLLTWAGNWLVNNLQHNPASNDVMDYLIDERKTNVSEVKQLRLGFLSNRHQLQRALLSKFSEQEVKNFMSTFHYNIGRTHTLIIPYTTIDGEVRGFTARALKDAKPAKYLYSKGMKRSDTLFASRKCEEKRPLVIVEGIFDAMLLKQRGNINTAALGGTSLNNTQIAKIQKQQPSAVILALDNDSAGNAATVDIMAKLQEKAPELPVRVVRTPARYKDPDGWIKAVGIDSFKNSFNQAVNSIPALREQEFKSEIPPEKVVSPSTHESKPTQPTNWFSKGGRLSNKEVFAIASSLIDTYGKPHGGYQAVDYTLRQRGKELKIYDNRSGQEVFVFDGSKQLPTNRFQNYLNPQQQQDFWQIRQQFPETISPQASVEVLGNLSPKAMMEARHLEIIRFAREFVGATGVQADASGNCSYRDKTGGHTDYSYVVSQEKNSVSIYHQSRGLILQFANGHVTSNLNQDDIAYFHQKETLYRQQKPSRLRVFPQRESQVSL